MLATAVPGWTGPQLPDALLEMLRTGVPNAIINGYEVAMAPPVKDRYNVIITPQSREMLLTAAELRTALMFADGATYQRIAAELGLSTYTVRNQISSAYRKLEVHSKIGLAAALK